MRIATYRRVSTEMQADEGFSLEAQKSRLQSYIDSQGWRLVEDYVDEGFSAKNTERPALKRLMEDIKKDKFDVVLVYRLDRLVRSVVDLHELLSLFEKHNVKFKSATEVFDTTSAMGRLFITMVAAMAQWERENLSERVHFGMKQMVLEGKRAGAKPPFGYDLQDKQLIINEEEAKWVRYIFEQYQTKGQQTIAGALNDMGIKTKSGSRWRSPVVYTVVTNPIYAGFIRWNYRKASGIKTGNEVIVKGEHEPIISKEQFDTVQEIIQKRTGKGFKGHTHYPFTGVLKCARCGSPMIGASRKRKHGVYRFYRCTGRFQSKICDMPLISEEVLAKTFLDEVEVPEYKEVQLPEKEDNTHEIEKKLSKVKSRIERIQDLYLDGDLTKQEYRERLEKERKKEEELVRQMTPSSNDINYEVLTQLVNDMKQLWEHATDEERKQLILLSVDSIIVEVTESSKGGPNQHAKISITDYAMK